MCSSPEITIVIPVRNRAKLVERSLDSVKAQTLRPLRLVLVDNGSTDDTPEALRRWAEANAEPDFEVLILSEPNPGAAAARNAGLATVTTEWTLFFDSDDEMLPTQTQRALECVKANPQASVIGWDVILRPLSGRDCVKPFATSHTLPNCVLRGTMATQRYMARTSLVRQAGGWRTDVMAWNDIELGARLLALKPVMAKAPGAPTVIVHAQGNSITGTNFSHHADDLAHALDCIEATVGDEGRNVVALKRAILAGLLRREGGNSKSARALFKRIRRTGVGYWCYSLCLFATAITAIGLPGASHLHRLCPQKIRKP